MAAPKGNNNSVGNSGGKSLNDRILASEVRSLTFTQLKRVLSDTEHAVFNKEFWGQVLLKLASNVLPRLNEHTGADGKDLNIGFDGIFKTPQ